MPVTLCKSYAAVITTTSLLCALGTGCIPPGHPLTDKGRMVREIRLYATEARARCVFLGIVEATGKGPNLRVRSIDAVNGIRNKTAELGGDVFVIVEGAGFDVVSAEAYDCTLQDRKPDVRSM